MKENINIDQLFQKASNMPVHTSFDATKEYFTASLAHRNVSKWKILRSKNWIIMIAIITSITAAGILYFGSAATNTHEKPTEQNAKKRSEQSASQPQEMLPTSGILPSEEQLKIMDPSQKESFVPMSPLDQRIMRFHLAPNLTDGVRSSSFVFDLAADRRNGRADSVEIPTLTEEEIADNHRMKKKMMKALAKLQKDQYAYIPSGSSSYRETVYSVNAFYMQVNEVSNLQYRTFLNDLVIQGRHDEYRKAYPQEHQWLEKVGGEDAMFRLYFSHPAFNEYPVVNVTREGAEMYCKWLTLETSKSKYVDNPMSLNDVRLPQRLEWTYAASNGNADNVYPWGSNTPQNNENYYLANYYPDTANIYADGAFFTARTQTYAPNEFGLYNMSGNVAEMVYGPVDFTSKSDLIEMKKDAGTAGGGWMDDAETIKIEADDPYAGVTEGHPNIGFRVVMTHLRRLN